MAKLKERARNSKVTCVATQRKMPIGQPGVTTGIKGNDSSMIKKGNDKNTCLGHKKLSYLLSLYCIIMI